MLTGILWGLLMEQGLADEVNKFKSGFDIGWNFRFGSVQFTDLEVTFVARDATLVKRIITVERNQITLLDGDVIDDLVQVEVIKCTFTEDRRGWSTYKYHYTGKIRE